MTKATIKTNKGDMKFNLYDDLAPKTVENFVTHAKNGYYKFFQKSSPLFFCFAMLF